jgi:SAM-dependent methyltransferase
MAGRTHPHIDNHGFWVGELAKNHHIYDQSLSNGLLEFLKRDSESNLKIVDLGCGMGDYVKHLKNHSINIDGFDGNPKTPELTNNLCGVKDIAVPFVFETPYDWVMSLEVGEHLPKEFEDIFINNLCNNCKKGIILSWALKGQGGYGHFNEQNNDYIKNKFKNLGYENDLELENYLRDKSTLCWFKNTIMVFRK